MSNKLVPFSIPILSKQLPKESFEVIKNEVISFISNNPELFKLAWDCSTKSTVHTKPHLNFKSNTLSKELKDLAIEYCNVFNFGELYLNGDEIWVNIAEQGAHQEAHTHTDFFSNIVFSGVLYIQTLENSGDLTLINPMMQLMKLIPPSTYNPDHINIKPQEGKLVMFPSFLEHSVKPNNNTQQRISVSFNIRATKTI